MNLILAAEIKCLLMLFGPIRHIEVTGEGGGMLRTKFCLTFLVCLITFLTVISAVMPVAIASDDPPSPEGDIEFILEPSYKVGEKIEFKIKNIGKVSYTYNQKYPACDLSYFDRSEREFIIPPATHCDMVITADIKPGETKKLFEWDGSECVLDNFGCSKREPLKAGIYTINGTFTSSADQDISTEAVATIELIK